MSPAKSPARKTAVTSASGPTSSGQTAVPPAPPVSPAVVPAVPPASPLVTTSVPVPAEAVGIHLPGVQLAQRPRHRGDGFGWPANAAPGKPEGEVDTRP
jgi:hypothetical protein